MSNAYSFGFSSSAIAIFAVALLVTAAPAADVRIPPSPPASKCVLPNLDAPPAATANCLDGTSLRRRGRARSR
jgi:hypothetical protein